MAAPLVREGIDDHLRDCAGQECCQHREKHAEACQLVAVSEFPGHLDDSHQVVHCEGAYQEESSTAIQVTQPIGYTIPGL